MSAPRSAGGPLNLLAAIAAIGVATGALAQEPARDWLIVPGEGVGPVTADSSLASLVAALGVDAAIEAEIEVGEGETETGALVFPGDPLATLAITWQDRAGAARPARVVVCPGRSGFELSCRWRTAEGITIGTRLGELEALNGRPLSLAGFGWDYGGTVVSWQGGALDAALNPDGWRLLVRLAPGIDPTGAWIPAVSQTERGLVLGDRDLPSDHPVMRKLDPRVYELAVVFPSARTAPGR